jgi:hypothetical protein
MTQDIFELTPSIREKWPFAPRYARATGEVIPWRNPSPKPGAPLTVIGGCFAQAVRKIPHPTMTAARNVNFSTGAILDPYITAWLLEARDEKAQSPARVRLPKKICTRPRALLSALRRPLRGPEPT